jgi:hypothetical protein
VSGVVNVHDADMAMYGCVDYLHLHLHVNWRHHQRLQLLNLAGITPSLAGNALSWGLYWVAWKSINRWWCEQHEVDDLPWGMKLLTGMQAGENENLTGITHVGIGIWSH